MYNRYIPGEHGYVRVPQEDGAPERRTPERPEPEHRPPEPEYRPPDGPERRAPERERRGAEELLRQLAAPLRFLGGEGKNAGVAGILKWLDLGDLDSGDVLLLLIMLFLLVEGDDLELVITLGLMLLFSLKREDQNE